jgi:phosphate transport system substrate-binding protein
MAAAADSAAKTPDDLRMSITNAPGAQAYPISSYTYVLLYKNQKDATKGKVLVDFLWWGVHDGKPFVQEMGYVPLPDDILKRTEGKINSVTAGGALLR